MFDKLRIQEHMEVTDCRGQHVGTVDDVEDNQIRLTRSDSKDGVHHFVPVSDVDRIEGNRVYLKESADIPQGA